MLLALLFFIAIHGTYLFFRTSLLHGPEDTPGAI